MEPLKVLIVDDENLAIEDLTILFEWERNGFDIVATAKNGEQALQKYHKYKPDIVITDIKMPIKSGIDLAKAIRKENQNIRIVFLSGYAEFDYAKQALDLDVEDYILKNEITAEKLSEKMLEIKDKILINRKKHGLIIQSIVADIFNSKKSYEEFYYSSDIQIIEFIRDSYFYMIIEEDLPLPFITLSETINESDISGALIEVSMNYEDDNFKVISANNLKPNRFLLVISGNSKTTGYSKYDLLKQFSIKLQNKLREHFHNTFSIIILSKKMHLHEAREDYLKYKHRIYSKYLLGTSLILGLEDDVLKGQTENILYDRIYIQNMIDEHNSEGLLGYIDVLFDQIITGKSYPALVLLTRDILAIIDKNGNNLKYIQNGKCFKSYSFSEKEYWLDIWSIKKCLKEKLKEIIDILVENSRVQYSREVYMAVTYIREHYNDETLDIKEIARHVSLSPTRFSFIFKKETGSTVLDFLTSFRIEKARELLKSSDYMMYEISKLVGYGSSQYFSQVFQKLTGVTPQHYKKRSD